MSEEFKRKLEAYEKGELSEEELEAFEKELDKFEEYQEYLEGNSKDTRKISFATEKKQKRIMRKGKWKARIQTAFSALLLFIGFTILSSIITAVYYSFGEPDRSTVLSKIIDYTLTVTDPYGSYSHTSTGTNAYFGLKATTDIQKVVGTSVMKTGEMETNFLFSLSGYPKIDNYGSISDSAPALYFLPDNNDIQSDWNTLEKLDEGTVVSAYVSLSKLLSTEEIFEQFQGKDIDLLWFAVDTGVEAEQDFLFQPIGFPSSPIWHDDDMIVTSREETKGLFGSKIISEGSVSPSYNEGDTTILQNQFLKTLTFLEKHEKKVSKLLSGDFEISERIEYLQSNEIKHYGVVITGPTKEVLKLKSEEWVNVLQVDEVSYWNWYEE